MNSKKIILYTLLILILSMCLSATAFAAGTATASMSGGGSVNVGDTVTVTLTYSGNEFGAYDASITYDSSILEYQSTSGAEAYGGSGSVSVTSSTATASSTMSCSLTFKAVKAGTATVKATTLNIYNIDLAELTASAASVTVSVSDVSAKASDNAELISLITSAGSLNPAFNSNVTTYSMNVPYETTVCTISAKTADDKASYSVTGSKELSVGTNVREVIVTAESGKTKTYTIKIYRAEKQETQSNEEQNNQQVVESENTEPEKDESEEKEDEKDEKDEKDDGKLRVTIDKKEYVIIESFEGIEIPAGFTETKKKYEDKKIPVIENEDKTVTLALLEKDDKTTWYFFNAKKDTFKKYKSITADEYFQYEETAKKLAEAEADKSSDNTNTLLMAMGGTVSLLLITLIALVVKKKK